MGGELGEDEVRVVVGGEWVVEVMDGVVDDEGVLGRG